MLWPLLSVALAQSPAPTLPSSDLPPPDLIYFAMVDRFADGAPNRSPIDPADPHGFHGGDLQGVIDHLDHLEALGVRTLWLSPIFEMSEDKIGEWGAFHGYWVRDLRRVDPRFGTLRDLRRLSTELHARDMRLVLDMVYNHTAHDAPMRARRPDWYHHNGDITDWDDPVQVVTHDVHGLPDLAQENPEVRDHLTAASLKWIDRVAVDGFRVDAVRHLPVDFLAGINATLDAHTGGFWTLGEDFEGDPAALSARMARAGFDAMFDFPLHYAMVDVFCRDAPPARLGSVLSLDRLYADPSRLVTFLDNHDLPRVASVCGDSARVERALAFQFVTRGTPCLTWGVEALAPGAGEPENRSDMAWGAPMPMLPLLTELQALRAAHPWLASAPTRVLVADGRGLVLLRSGGGESALIVAARGERTVSIPEALVGAEILTGWSSGLTGLPTEGALPGSLEVQAEAETGLVVALVRGAITAPIAELADLLVVVTPPELGPGERLVAVGSGPELGSWDPGEGVPLDVGPDGFAAGNARVPAGAILAWKLVVVGPEGARWEQRADRFRLVTGDGVLIGGWEQP